jgi:4-hydroxythreonine-4-phosphate dehydrogenase
LTNLLPKIAITMGDPAGVGPELCLRLLADAEVAKVCTPIVFGDRVALCAVAAACDLPLPTNVFSAKPVAQFQASDRWANVPSVVDLGLIQPDQIAAGKISQHTGAASYAYINAAIDAALAGTVDAVTTGPIHKEAWQSAGIRFPGHTELFADRAGTDRFCMMMTSPAFSCSLVTTHVGYDAVPKMLTTELILEVTELTHDALTRIYGRPPRLTMMGLNPHAGEGGLFGNREEEIIIAPAVAAARSQGMKITDPLPPDTAFLPWRRNETDGYICMYHDQGLIPFKAFNFDTGVNITLGLPLIRTSVDHGTALDIAWTGKADVSSLIAAVNLAAKLAQTSVV